MSFSAAVQWWEDWQLRLLVLASLFFQCFLFAAAIVRKLRVPHWFRAIIWLAYQAGDVVAVYALATLFTRHKEEALATNPATAHLQTLWAPILLLHLGGQDGITAYSIEDNENWRRHLLISVSQITVAIYVFRKSWWSGEVILLRAAILLFIPGILKCLEKPWALKNATVTSIMNSYDSTLDEDDGVQKKDVYSLEEYVQAAAESVAKLGPQRVELFEDEAADKPYHLLVDVGHPYSIRLQNLCLVAPVSARDVHRLVRSSLSKAFDRLYTKHRASLSGLLRAAVALATFVVIGLFHRSHRGVYDRADVVVTYVLLGFTAALELVSACLVLGSGLPPPDDKLAQYNLVGYLVRGEKHRWLLALARLLGARLQLDRLWCTAAPEPSLGITKLVHNHIADGWKDYIWRSLYEHDAATGGWKRNQTPADDGVRAYQRFNDSRGQWTLKRKGCIGRSAIEESLRMPFDESVMLWHLATEFCYFDHVDTGHDAIRHSRMLSNYMAYLLFVEPEMLIPGARSKLFGATYHELRKMLKPSSSKEEADEPPEKKVPLPRTKNEMLRKVVQKVKSTIGLGSEDLVHKAWAVAHELMEFANEKKRGFIKAQRESLEKRKEVVEVLCCAKEKADEFIDIKNKERYKVLNNLIEFMDSSQKKAQEFIINIQSNNIEEATERKTIFIKDMKEAKEKLESFFNEEEANNQTKEEERITNLLQCARNKAKEFIEYEQDKMEAEASMDIEENKVLTVKDFSENAKELIQLAEVEKKKLMVDGRMEAKEKAEKFISEAKNFISKEKRKNQTKEEKRITELLESAMNKAHEFIDNEQKRLAAAEPSRKPTAVEKEKSVLKEFSKQAGEAIKLVKEEDEKPKELMGRNLIANEEELLMIRGTEHADDNMWAVIQGVWVEMLCFSASRCRGYLHAKRLGNGGEYLSYVWLLLYYMGMETMPERMQRPELTAVGDTGALVKIRMDEEWDEQPARVRRRTKSSAGTAQPAQPDLEIGSPPVM